jgi:phosphate transport system substrate-binding protein
LIGSSHQPDPQTAEAIRHFLLWAVSPEGGNAPKYLNSVGFIPLPTFIRALSEHQIE